MPRRPLARMLEPSWIEEKGEPLLVLRDREGLLPAPVAVPAVIGFVLSLCDGTRDDAAICDALQKELGESLPGDAVAAMIDQLEEAMILDGEKTRAAREQALAAFRAAPRPATLAGAIYPADVAALRQTIAEFGRDVDEPSSTRDTDLRGVISPHIDYQRGGKVYHRVFRRAAPAIREADVLVVFGTDHSGSPGSLTLTRQGFETPFGRLESDRRSVDALVDALGEETAFAEELHHRGEHSIELAAVWAASVLEGARPTIAPILTGSFHRFTSGEADPRDDARFAGALEALKSATAGKRVVAIAAADLAHVGPAFGDPTPLDEGSRRRLREQDEALLHAVAWGQHESFFDQLRQERDARRICGLPPIYMTLRYLGEETRGEVVAYDQCSADPQNGSFVSVAGVLLW